MEKHLLIFGANGALGQGVTKALLQKDYKKIYLFGSSKVDIPERGNVIQIKTGNLSEEAEVAKTFDNIKASKETLYFLFSTIGGFTGGKRIWESDIKDFDNMMNINLKTSFLIGKYFSGLVKGSAGGSILFTSAMTGLAAEKGKMSYGVSKSSVNFLVETLALEGADINLSANSIAPFIIDTPANRSWMGNNYDYETLVKPAEIGDLVHSIFLNFRIISGNVIKVPGRIKIQDDIIGPDFVIKK